MRLQDADAVVVMRAERLALARQGMIYLLKRNELHQATHPALERGENVCQCGDKAERPGTSAPYILHEKSFAGVLC